MFQKTDTNYTDLREFFFGTDYASINQLFPFCRSELHELEASTLVLRKRLELDSIWIVSQLIIIRGISVISVSKKEHELRRWREFFFGSDYVSINQLVRFCRSRSDKFSPLDM